MLEIDPTLGPYCNQRRLNHYVDIAKHLERLQGMGPIRVWYDANDDYVKIAFAYAGSDWLIRGYKVYAVLRDGKKEFIFSREYNMLEFFEGLRPANQ